MGKKRKPPPPAKPGIAHQHLLDNYGDIPAEMENLKKGHVLLLFCKNGRSVASTIRAITEHFPGTCSTGNLMKPLIKQFESFKNLGKENEKLRYDQFCKELFTSFSSVEQDLTTPECESDVLQVETPEPVQISSSQLKTPDTPAPGDVPGSSGVTPRLRRGQLTPRKLKMKDTINYLSRTRSDERTKYKSRIKNLKGNLNLLKLNEIKYLNQDITRKKISMTTKNAKITLLKKEIKELKKGNKPRQPKHELSEENVKKLQRNHKRLKQHNKSKRKKVKNVTKEQYKKVQKELEAKDQLNKQYENQILELQEKIAEMEIEKKNKETKADGKTYSTSTRLEVFDHIVNQVPTQNIPTLIQASAKRRGETLSSVPCRTTTEQMARELACIADLQSADLAMKSENLTIGFDATTQEGVHINSIHLTTKDECNVIAVDELAGGTADDYHNHIISSVDHLARTYSDYHQEDYQYCRKKIISNISNTMNDRVVVNHATVKKVNESWGKTLNELNCHLHPLDTIASSCRSALKSMEVSKGHLYGNDCMAANIIVQVNKIRYKDGKGDPKGFKTFLNDAGLPLGIIPRYRGNRLHILFHISGKLVEHHKQFVNFFSTGACSCGGLVASVLKDLQSDVGILELQVLGLLGKLLTGPWMQLFYTSSQGTDSSHVDGIEMVKDVLAELQEVAKSPRGVFLRTTDFFGRQLPHSDQTLKSLQAEPADLDLFEAMFEACLVAVITVIERQYKRYFQLDITEELRRQTSSSRMHNIDAEEIMGMFSASKERAKNAQVDFLSARMRSRKNGVVAWLDDVYPQVKRDSIIKWAISRARKQRKVHRLKEKELKEEMSRRASNKRQKKSNKERKEIEKKVKDIDVDNLRTVFPDLAEDRHSVLVDILTGTIVGRNICHAWYDEQSGSKTVYFGKVEKLKKRNRKPCYKIAYWSADEQYEDATDFDIPKAHLVADFICEDLIFN